MKTLFFFMILLILSSCSTTGRYSPENGVCEDSERSKFYMSIGLGTHSDAYQNCMYRIESERKNKDFLEKHPEFIAEMEQLKKRRTQATKFKTPLSEFIYCFGEPDTKELVNGDLVYWYNGKTPVFATFKNEKLASLTIDRDTLRNRQTERYQDAITEFLNRPPPTVSTDCYRFGNSVHCTSR